MNGWLDEAAIDKLEAMVGRAINKILVPVELVEEAAPNADYAIELAAQLKADLILVAVLDTPAAASMIANHRVQHSTGDGFNDILVEEAKLILQGIVDQAAKVGVVAWGHATVSEEVEAHILKEAIVQKVDLILVRSHGRSGISRALCTTCDSGLTRQTTGSEPQDTKSMTTHHPSVLASRLG